MLKQILSTGTVVALAAGASADIIVTPELLNTFDIGSPTFSARSNPHAFYSDVDTFTGSVNTNGGATNVGGNVMTRMVVDDLQLTGPQTVVSRLTFSVSNLNAANTSARARIRLYADDNSGQPGTLLAGLTSTTMTFGPNSVSLFTVTMPAVATPGKIWAGILFDNNGGLTGSGTNELNNLGQGVFNPPAIGLSQDLFFRTTSAGSFLSNNPSGSVQSGGAGPVGNFAWEVIPAPGAASVLALAGLVVARRRR